MITKGKKELILCVYYLLNAYILEEVLRVELGSLELEKKFHDRKVDIFAVTPENTEVYIEVQLGDSDNSHLEQIIKIINSNDTTNNFIIVWIAAGFKKEHIEEVLKAINGVNKNIEFVAIRLKRELIPMLQELDDLNVLSVMGKINSLSEISNHLMVNYRYYKLINLAKQSNESIEEPLNNYKEMILKQVSQEMKIQLSYFINVYRAKATQGNIIVMGAGISDVTYHIGINKYNFIYVGIRFLPSKRNVYNELIKQKETINLQLDYRAEWQDLNGKIETYIRLKESYGTQIKEAVRVLHKYIQCFTKLSEKNN